MPDASSFFKLLARETIKRTKHNITRLVNRKAIAMESQILSEATRHFNDGNLELAVNCYRQVKLDPYASQIAGKMLGWISYLKGNLENGWPVYPVTSIDRVPLIEFLTGYLKFAFSNAIRVRKAARPWELKYLLRLKEWSPGSQPSAGVLVWFNFGSSIGGEILCGKLLGMYSDLNKGLRITCAIDARLIDLFKDTFPSIAFISKKDSLAIKQARFDYFLLGKDLLGLIASSERDFLELKQIRMIPSGEPIRLSVHQGTFKVAISWKTTNVEQGKYRNIPLRMLVEVLKKYPFTYFSAQHGITDDECAYLSSELGSQINFDFFRPTGSLNDFCLKLQQMDLVLSIDNSTMHMAGGIGVKTYGLLSIPSYWAYPMSGEDSRWYDSVCLIRQSAPGDWNAVIADLDKKLEAIYGTCGFYISTT
jgi:hypothetical protein